MKLIVISDPDFTQSEAQIMNELFGAGLRNLHLRKPDCLEKDLYTLIGKIDPRYYNRISLHQHHGLAGVFGFRRLHFTERSRQQTGETTFNNLRNAGFTLSTSVHDLSQLASLSDAFSYTFFGPLFKSISKIDYPGILPDDFYLHNDIKKLKVIGLGGIGAENIEKVRQLNFDGAAVLGYLWKDPKNGVERFLKLQAKIHRWQAGNKRPPKARLLNKETKK